MDPLLLRFIERITALLIGGVSIYIGYRLFLSVPEQRDSSGKVTLPWNISVVMTRVGPGVFFALFGITAVCFALVRPLTIESASGARASYAGAAPLDSSARAEARALLRRDMALLNAIPRELRHDLPAPERADIERGLTRVKLSLMKPVWESKEGFGDFAAFEKWALAGDSLPQPEGMSEAVALYRYGARP